MRPWMPPFALFLWLGATACERAEEAQGTPELSAEAHQEARALYLRHCALCHGQGGDGRGARRSGLIGHPADFTDPGWPARMTFRQVVDVIDNGKPGTSMPAWRSLDREQIRWLAAYVLSIAERGP